MRNAAPISSSYLTVDPNLKGVLDQVEKTEKKDEPVLMSLATTRMNDLKTIFSQQVEMPKVLEFVLSLLLSQSGLAWRDYNTVALGLTEISDAKISAALARGAEDAKIVQGSEKAFLQILPKVVALTGRDIVSKNASQSNFGNMPNGMPMANGMQMPNGMPPNMMPPNMQPPNGAQVPAPGGQFPGGVQGPVPGGLQGPMPGGQFPGGFGPNMRPGGGQDEKKEEPKGKDGDYLVWSKDKVVALGVNININEEVYQTLSNRLEQGLKGLKGMADMADNRSRIHELAEATQAFLKKEGHFPRGTVPRDPSADRDIDYRPDQRLSWMVQLLPYVANGEFRELLPDNERLEEASWNEPPNLAIAMTVIPQFLAPLPPDKPYSYYIQYPTIKGMPVAATHFVGIAGIGLDAAEYRSDDPATAKLRGIFGYDRETKPEEIKDGLAETILLLQVPADHKSPWMAGGGSTVRGVSEDLDCVQSFVCTEYQGKRGTFAIMADGKVRFISAAIDPKTFQAMCTIAGGEKIKDLSAVAPEVPPPEELQQPELKAEAPPPPANPAPQPAAPAAPAPAPAADGKTAALLTNQLKMIGLAYHSYSDNGRPPAKAEDLAPLYENDKKITAALKDGTIVVFWNSSFKNMPAGTSNTVLGYEKDAKDKGGLVLMADGSVRTMTAKEFNAATKAPGK